MADNHTDPDFRSMINAAAAKWYSQRRSSLEQSQPNRGSYRQDGSDQMAGNGAPAMNGSEARCNVTAWQSALDALPHEIKSVRPPIHPLANALAEQPALRSVEWNQYRQQGGFKPRMAADYTSLMIYVSGQVNPNPCRNCRLKNGPYARCVVSPPSVLALSSLKHACANCTYQNQHRKCTNLPIDNEELVARNRIARSSQKFKNPARTKPPGRPRLITDKSANPETRYKPDHRHMIQKPTIQSITAEAFADKLRQVRSWSPQSRRLMKAEVTQWQAVIMTVEAESTHTSPKCHTEKQERFGTPNIPPSIPSALPTPSRPAATSSLFIKSPSMDGSVIDMEAEQYGEVYSQQQMDGDRENSDDENAEDNDYEGVSRIGFSNMGPAPKPPLQDDNNISSRLQAT